MLLSSPIACVACERTELLGTEITVIQIVRNYNQISLCVTHEKIRRKNSSEKFVYHRYTYHRYQKYFGYLGA